MIELASGLQLPESAVTNSYALLAMKGAGKSNAAVVFAEQLFAASIPWVCIDPKGDWWGIRSGAGGRGKGLPVPIFGGVHADVPIDPKAGKLFADLVVDQHLTCLIDTSELTKGESIRFLTAFFDQLYRRKNRSTYPMHLFLEEADDYVPQKVYGDVAALVRTVELVVKRGRQRGLGITLATQRAASVNKDALTQTDTLIVLRTTSPQDRKAIKEWLDYHAGAADIVDELPTLEDGEAWVSSPAQLRILKKVKFRRRSTFDSGATPELGEKVKPATLADIDVAAITAAVGDLVEKVKADDPKTLHAQIVHLERELDQAPQPIEVEVVHEVVPPRVVEALSATLAAYDELLEGFGRARRQLADRLDDVTKISASQPLVRDTRDARAGSARKAAQPAPERNKPPRQPSAHNPSADDPHRPLAGGEVKILTALAQAAGGTLKRSQAAVYSGYRARGGHYGNMLGALRTAGYLEASRDPLRITDAGRAALGPVDEPPTGAELLEWWMARTDVKNFGGGAKRILRALVEAWPDSLTKAELADECSLDVGGGHFGNMLGRLRTLGLVNKTGDPQLTDEFGEAIT